VRVNDGCEGGLAEAGMLVGFTALHSFKWYGNQILYGMVSTLACYEISCILRFGTPYLEASDLLVEFLLSRSTS
jgi:hypothetical protein